MKVLRFRTAVMICSGPANTSCFTDGTFNQMWLDGPADHEPFAEAAGYGADWRRYITEHDALHHVVADELGQPWSYALHDGDGGVPIEQAPQRIRDEEHLVQRLQRLMMLGEADPYGQLEARFGEWLPRMVAIATRRLDSVLGPVARHVMHR